MRASEIIQLPDSFDFKSNINDVCRGMIYHATKVCGTYYITWENGGKAEYPTHAFNQKLLHGDFEVVGGALAVPREVLAYAFA